MFIVEEKKDMTTTARRQWRRGLGATGGGGFDPRTTIHKKKENNNDNDHNNSGSSGVLCGRSSEGYDYLYELPSSSAATAISSVAKGIMFLAHGCGHKMEDFWPPPEEHCPNCVGLPEGRVIVQMKLEEPYQLIVVSTSSQGLCWGDEDGSRVANILQEFSNKNLPFYAFGASSGGHFVSTILPEAMNKADNDLVLSGFISTIAPSYPSSIVPSKGVYITKDRDERSTIRAEDIVHATSNTMKGKHMRLSPLPIDDDYFSDRIIDISKETSRDIVHALKENNMIDEKGYLRKDPRKSNWRVDEIRKLVPNDSLVADKSSIAEVLNVAWALHEMSRDGVESALDFIIT